MKTWTLKVSEEELKAIINHHVDKHHEGFGYDTERSARIHDLTKRLNKDTPEIEGDPRPKESTTTMTGADPENNKADEASPWS